MAACQALGYDVIGVESDLDYVQMAVSAIPKLAALKTEMDYFVNSNGGAPTPFEHHEIARLADGTEVARTAWEKV